MTAPNQPQLDLAPIKAYLEVAAKLGYGGTGLRHMAALVDEVERLTVLTNMLRSVDGTNQALRETIAGMAGERLELLRENERLTNRLNWLERCMGQQTDFTGHGQGNKIVLDLDKSQVVQFPHTAEAGGLSNFFVKDTDCPFCHHKSHADQRCGHCSCKSG
jgi:hypothetical protein